MGEAHAVPPRRDPLPHPDRLARLALGLSLVAFVLALLPFIVHVFIGEAYYTGPFNPFFAIPFLLTPLPIFVPLRLAAKARRETPRSSLPSRRKGSILNVATATAWVAAALWMWTFLDGVGRSL